MFVEEKNSKHTSPKKISKNLKNTNEKLLDLTRQADQFGVSYGKFVEKNKL